MRGRKPVPAAMLRLAGSRRAKGRGGRGKPATGPAGPHEPLSTASTAAAVAALHELPSTSAPAHLSKLAGAKWRELLPLLTALGSLSRLDVDQLAAYCEAYAAWVECGERLASEGLVVGFPNGAKGVSPWLRIQRNALDRMDKSGAELGLTPIARARLRLEIPEENALDAYMAAGQRARPRLGRPLKSR